MSVSNPKSKYVAYLSVLSQFSNCQGLGRKNKHDILKTDRNLSGGPTKPARPASRLSRRRSAPTASEPVFVASFALFVCLRFLYVHVVLGCSCFFSNQLWNDWHYVTLNHILITLYVSKPNKLSRRRSAPTAYRLTHRYLDKTFCTYLLLLLLVLFTEFVQFTILS